MCKQELDHKFGLGCGFGVPVGIGYRSHCLVSGLGYPSGLALFRLHRLTECSIQILHRASRHGGLMTYYASLSCCWAFCISEFSLYSPSPSHSMLYVR